MLQRVTSLRARTAGSAFFVLGAMVCANLFLFQEKRRVSPVETAALTARMTSDGLAVPNLSAQDYANGGPIVLRPNAGSVTQSSLQAQSPGRPASEPAMSRADVIRAIQRELNTRGYAPGAPDGVAGLVTRAAIMAYEHDTGIALTGDATQEILGRIVLGPAVPAAARPGKSEVKGPEAAAVVKLVAQSLTAQGYGASKSDGTLDAALVKAIREFEADQKLPDTGRVSAALVSRLIRLQGQTRATAQR
jgi:peptidoglycan hydrolase-like protein with peptidoglycan-binding domain